LHGIGQTESGGVALLDDLDLVAVYDPAGQLKLRIDSGITLIDVIPEEVLRRVRILDLNDQVLPVQRVRIQWKLLVELGLNPQLLVLESIREYDRLFVDGLAGRSPTLKLIDEFERLARINITFPLEPDVEIRSVDIGCELDIIDVDDVNAEINVDGSRLVGGGVRFWFGLAPSERRDSPEEYEAKSPGANRPTCFHRNTYLPHDFGT